MGGSVKDEPGRRQELSLGPPVSGPAHLWVRVRPGCPGDLAGPCPQSQVLREPVDGAATPPRTVAGEVTQPSRHPCSDPGRPLSSGPQFLRP